MADKDTRAAASDNESADGVAMRKRIVAPVIEEESLDGMAQANTDVVYVVCRSGCG